MPGRPTDPSGAKITMCIRLSPAHLVKLDRLAEGSTRTAVIESFIDAATGAVAQAQAAAPS